MSLSLLSSAGHNIDNQNKVGFIGETSLYYPFDTNAVNSNQSTTTPDAILQGSLATINTSIKKWGSGSLYLAPTSQVGQFNSWTSPYVKLPNFQLTSGSGFSISLWMYPTANANYTAVCELSVDYTQTGSSNQILISMTPSDILQFYVFGASGSNTSGFAVNMNQWNHVVWSISSTGTWTIYNNGSLVKPVTGAIPATASHSINTIGVNVYGHNNYQGYIDSFRVNNNSLTSTQVTTLYSSA